LLTSLIGALLIAQGCLPLAAKRPLPTGVTGEGMIGRAAVGLVANNAGTLTGTVRGPSASLVANNAGNLIANNGAGLIANNGGGLTGRYGLLATDGRIVAVAGATVTVTDMAGQALTGAPVTTDAQGAYSIKGLKPSGALVVVHVRYTAAGHPVTLKALVAAPRQGDQASEVTPGSTMVAKKVAALVANRTVTPQALSAIALQALTARLSPLMSDRAIAIAALQDDEQAAHAFDVMAGESPALAEAAGAAAPALAAAPTAAPASTAPGAAPTAPPTATSPPAAGEAEASPTPAPAPRLLRLAGGDTAGYTEAGGGDLLTARFTELGGLAWDGRDTLYVADEGGDHIRQVNLTSRTTALVAGSARGESGDAGDGGPATAALLHDPHGLAWSTDGKLYICDEENHRIRVVGPDKVIRTVVGGGADLSGNGPGTALHLGHPKDIEAGADGRLFFSVHAEEGAAEAVCRLNPDGTVTTLTNQADISAPTAIAVDRARGLLYFADKNMVKLLRGIDAAPGKPETLYTAPVTGQRVEIRGLAHDQGGSLYVLATDYDAGAGRFGGANTRVYRLPLGADGLGAGAAEAIAGTGGTGADAAAYSVPAAGVRDPLTQLLAGNAANALSLGPNGTLIVANAYKLSPDTGNQIRFGQLLTLVR
jgi:sugar lactone lactonase YvrE